MATVSFMTLFLGLTLGPQAVTVATAPEIHAVDVLLDGQTVDRAGPGNNWTVPVDFGTALSPHTLEAVAYGAEGRELGRARQLVNLPRPPAEAELVIERDKAGAATTARVLWESVGRPEPLSVEGTFDGRPLAVTDPHRIELPPHDPQSLHFLRVQLEFSDVVTTTVEATFGGTYRDETRTELTAIPVTLDAEDASLTPERLAGWFATRGGNQLTPVAVEKGPAEVVFVLDGAARPALWELARTQILLWSRRYQARDNRFRRALKDETEPGHPNTSFWRSAMLLREGQSLRILWPYAERVDRQGAPFELFSRSEDHPPEDGGVFWILSEARPPERPAAGQRLADAVAVAGMTATGRARRRAVVLVLGPQPEDASRFDPGSVRGYLEQLGVPFEVWVVGKARRETRRRWGDAVRSVSSVDSFGRAVDDLAERLDHQRIVWLEGRHLPQEIVLTDRARGLERAR